MRKFYHIRNYTAVTISQPATLTLLGTGSVKGRPVYGCYCPACFEASQDPFLIRRPASGVIDFSGKKLLLDAGLPDLEERFPAGSITAILLTHYHMDHITGLYSLRWGESITIPVIGPDKTGDIGDLHQYPGILDFSQTVHPYSSISMDYLTITPVPLQHTRPCFGYLLSNEKSIAYLTDTDGLSEGSMKFLLKNAPDILIIDCTFPPGKKKKSASHNDIYDVIKIHEYIQPERTLLTHLSHDVDCWLQDNSDQVPKQISTAMDGMVINF